MTEQHAIVRVDTEPPRVIAQGIDSRTKAGAEAERRSEQSPAGRYQAVAHTVLRSAYARDDLTVVDATDTEDTDA
jgi:hypothetical protein